MMTTYTFCISTAFDNKDDWFPHIRSIVEQNIEGSVLACDWPTLARGFAETKFGPGEKVAARFAIRDTEIQAVINSDIFILALPGGNGTFFEYGLAYATMMFAPKSARIVVYAPNMSFVDGELGHFIGLEGTVVVIGDEAKLIEALQQVKLAIYNERLH